MSVYGCLDAQYTRSGILTLLPNRSSPCDGTVVNAFEWKTAEWITSKAVTTYWMKRDVVPQNTLGVTVDFVKLSEYVSMPSLYQRVNSLQNQVTFLTKGFTFCFSIHFFLFTSLCLMVCLPLSGAVHDVVCENQCRLHCEL